MAKKRPAGWTLNVALRSFWTALTRPGYAEQVEPFLVSGRLALPAPTPSVQKTPPTTARPATLPATPTVPPKPTYEAVRLLALLQRDGRLVDFLMEDISNLPDAQIGAAVRDIHRSCRKALQEHVELEAVVPQSEDEPITVEAGFDPSAIRLEGNISGQPPYKGVVAHRGWKVKEMKLPPLPTGQTATIVAPAEVEVT